MRFREQRQQLGILLDVVEAMPLVFVKLLHVARLPLSKSHEQQRKLLLKFPLKLLGKGVGRARLPLAEERADQGLPSPFLFVRRHLRPYGSLP